MRIANALWRFSRICGDYLIIKPLEFLEYRTLYFMPMAEMLFFHFVIAMLERNNWPPLILSPLPTR